MDDLVAFLCARYDEREAGRSQIHDEECSSFPNPIMGRQECDCGEPDFVLADVAAKRQILHEHRVIDGRCHVCTAIHEGHARRFRAPCPTLRLLALPYAGHPDYREEWKP